MAKKNDEIVALEKKKKLSLRSRKLMTAEEIPKDPETGEPVIYFTNSPDGSEVDLELVPPSPKTKGDYVEVVTSKK